MPLSHDLKCIAASICSSADTPRALTVAILLRNGEMEQLVNLKTDPSQYTETQVDKYRKDNMCTELLRKLNSLEIPGIDLKKRALDSFWESERQCARTAARLDPYLKNGPLHEGPNEARVYQSLVNMQNWIRDVLGPLPGSCDIERFGPGSTFEDVGKHITVPDKMTSRPTLTMESALLLPFWEKTAWARALYSEYPGRSSPKVVRGNRFTTVPKDALKDRGICIEPSINVAFQLTVGRLIRARLKRYGIDLKTGQETHRQMARSASLSGDYATIDLSNASDTVSRTLVKLLLAKSPEWLSLLETLRSPCTLVEGKWVHLSKFSSMGNGFTFELETLIFAAISCEAMRLHNVSPETTGHTMWVYGDDLIVPVVSADTNLQLLKFCGFTPNGRKTFLYGGFRESCGGDFLYGAPVRAHYVKEEPTQPQQWISLANGLRRSETIVFDLFGPFSYLWRPWLGVLDNIPVDVRRLRGPSSLGDLVIHDEKRFWQTRQTADGRRFARTYSPVTRVLSFKHWRPLVVLAAALFGVDSGTKHRYGLTPRDAVTGYRKKWVTILG